MRSAPLPLNHPPLPGNIAVEPTRVCENMKFKQLKLTSDMMYDCKNWLGMSEGTNTVMGSSEDGTNISQDDKGTTEETPEDMILLRQTSVNLVPFIGQRFASQDAAYEFYCNYAKQCGFSIRRHCTRGKDGVGRGVTRRDFTCHRGGYPQMKQSEDGKMQRNRKSSRCGCQAYMRIVKRAYFDVPEWRVTGFSNIHNYEMFKLNETHLLPASGTMSPDDKSRICIFAKAGMSVRQMLRLMELEKGVKLGCLPYTKIDKLKDEDHNFKYDFKIDCNNRIEHIAWSYASFVRLYEAFGDAVVFDTTHHLDAYDMWLGIWVGIDNHGMACFFSCVLLREENMGSFSWALNLELPQKLHKVYLKTGSPIESHATSVLTPYAFGKFQEELMLAPQYASFLVDEYCFQVRHHTQISGGYKVIWDSCQGHISCSCRWFEYSGILCRHALRVLSTNNCFQIPDDYLPTRWQYVSSSSSSSMHSEKIQLLESMASTLMAESVETKERLDVACEQISMVLSHLRDLPTLMHGENAYNCPSDSLILLEVVDSGGIVNFTIENPDDPITLAKLKERQPRVGVDKSRKRRHHSGPCCRHFRHDASDCPVMRSDQMDGTALGYL
ncbi:hypothetical protein SADUNF_Sadunf08G0087600 [Salix dunnii]|uniref:Protein FAR1-RELATED SEQUENCE n=1 Tax=Salix dunnii TaxID=1413687 RepID=A0A835MSH3_9ROSI|nr:hypothetical protein SADUNF_Sadunf08G0087600 [Salix dunnii]